MRSGGTRVHAGCVEGDFGLLCGCLLYGLLLSVAFGRLTCYEGLGPNNSAQTLLDGMPPDRTQLRAWFAFVLRVLGIWEILSAASWFLTGLNISIGLTKEMSPGSTSFGSVMTHTFGDLILALWLLKGAPSIAKFFYPDPPPSDKKPSDSDTPTI